MDAGVGAACSSTWYSARMDGLCPMIRPNRPRSLSCRRSARFSRFWALISAMSRLLSDKSLRGKLSNVAQASVIERFDRERVIDRLERLYAGNEDEKPVVVKKRR